MFQTIALAAVLAVQAQDRPPVAGQNPPSSQSPIQVPS